MSCDFKPGDEVVKVSMGGPRTVTNHPLMAPLGAIGTVTGVILVGGVVGFSLKEWPSGGRLGHAAHNWRKVVRRTDKQSLTEWLSQPSGDTDHLDKPLPAKKRERAS